MAPPPSWAGWKKCLGSDLSSPVRILNTAIMSPLSMLSHTVRSPHSLVLASYSRLDNPDTWATNFIWTVSNFMMSPSVQFWVHNQTPQQWRPLVIFCLMRLSLPTITLPTWRVETAWLSSLLSAIEESLRSLLVFRQTSGDLLVSETDCSASLSCKITVWCRYFFHVCYIETKCALFVILVMYWCFLTGPT